MSHGRETCNRQFRPDTRIIDITNLAGKNGAINRLVMRVCMSRYCPLISGSTLQISGSGNEDVGAGGRVTVLWNKSVVCLVCTCQRGLVVAS